MNKRVILIFGLVVFFGVFASGQGVGDQAQDAIDQIEESQDKIDEIRSNYTGQAWREILLESEPVKRFDLLLTALNPLFVIFMARKYTFSLVMLFAFMLWLFTYLSLVKYFVIFESDKRTSLGSHHSYLLNLSKYRWIAALAATVFLAHLQVFNIFALGFEKIIFYRYSFGWKIAMSVLIFTGLFVYLYINRYFAGMIKAAKKRNKDAGLEYRVRKMEKYQEGLEEAEKYS